jgi:hypothetical protein
MVETPNPFPIIQAFHLPLNLMDATVAVLREEGGRKVESLVFWAGRVSRHEARVTRILVPRGPGVLKHPFHIQVSDRIIAALCDFIDPPEVVLLGQVHTHKHRAFHSWSDDANSLDTPGYLSVVVPDFARNDASSWETWSFHECIKSRTFRRLSLREVKRRMLVEPRAHIEVHHVTG